MPLLHYPNLTQPQPIPHPYPNPTLTLTFWLGVSYHALSRLSSRLKLAIYSKTALNTVYVDSNFLTPFLTFTDCENLNLDLNMNMNLNLNLNVNLNLNITLTLQCTLN